MKPPVKRRKTSVAQTNTDEDDELFIEPEEINRRRDPNVQLQQGRDRAANRLKSRFESIFAKYEKDFDGVGDVIDIMTGEIVEDNGHLRSMEVTEVGRDETGEDSSDEEQDHSMMGDKYLDREPNPEAMAVPRDPWKGPEKGPESRWPQMGMRGTPQLSSLFGNGNAYMMMPAPPFPPLDLGPPSSVDPNWQAPELPQSAFLSDGHEQEQAPRKGVRKSLLRPHSRDADDEEDVLLGTSGSPLQTKESPLIRQKFPAVDSSPNNDNSHYNLIKDVIENMPDTPPSIRKTRTARSLGKPSPLRKHHAKPRIARRPQNRKGGRRSEGTKELSQVEKAGHVETETESVQHVDACQQNPVDQTSWQDSDVELFLDVTGAGSKKPARQRLFVDISMTKQISQGTSGSVNRRAIKEVADEAVRVCKKSTVELPVRISAALHEVTAKGRHSQATLEDRQGKQTEDSGKKPREKFARNMMDPDFMFSDEETLLPRRRVRRQTGPTGRPLAAVLVDTPGSSEAPHAQEQPSEAEQQSELKPLHTQVRAPRRRCSSKLGSGSGSAVKDTITEQPRSEPVGTDASRAAQQQPSTPQAKSKQTIGTPATTASLISLLSDAEDDEDEISFDLSEFTPSGHHRILVHRPLFPRLSTSFSSSIMSNKNTKKKTKRASLNLGTHSTKSHKFRTPARTTPLGPVRGATTGDDTRKKMKKVEGGRRTKKLAQSVVRVLGQGSEVNNGGTGRSASPAGSVVQTPGGTRRRCGEDGWTCERDFCFICM
ncbi:hypothetical protein M406DRAFT_71004 [Cryphonectria parasitica EP155]|uniref:Uncharacterized protein n=1 Tax=Cryphonectria parasitica (strain ATCC 38755 / EP155) TaxID=660469 RepID=A0A9P4Y0K0_CRYP1|nr:uncharacterized protein M406DRAFT_71004 [Cryphonectria parasitica EP155]KAF3764458.1 hypothetical protein M406DRAFT_71004 [Cryphonectria parasitica EP155]